MDVSPLNSIRVRLTLWYALTLAAILAVSALFSYQYFSNNLHKQLDHELYEIARVLEKNNEKLFNEEQLNKSCENLMDITHLHNWGAYVLLRDSSLSSFCFSHNLLERELPFGPVARQQVRWLKPHLETVHDDHPIGEQHELRLLSYPVVRGGDLYGVIQIGKHQGPMHETVENLRTIYLVVGPFAIFWLCLGCWFLADRLLLPIIDVTEAAQSITADKLGNRLPVSSKRDEISLMTAVLNQMLDRLENSFRRIRQFSGDASHELRTPLTILRGETEVTLRWGKTVDEFRDMLHSNMEEIDRMERIIESLLTLAKSEAGELTLEMKSLSLSDLLQEIYLQGKILADKKQISVDLLLQVSEEVKIRGDELRLRQMLLNLLANAVKYTLPGGALSISLAVDGDWALVGIEDTGVGIPEEDLPYIFDRFYRVDKARNRMDGGTGLGLSIVKWVVDVHGGTVSVTSSVDKGSLFTVKLPLKGPEKNPVDDGSHTG